MLIALWASLALAEPPPSRPEHGGTTALKRPALCEHLATQGPTAFKVPGRKPDSQVPFELFLGHASHSLIAYIYRTRHPTDTIYYNITNIKTILSEGGIGDWLLLTEKQCQLRPDITNATTQKVFEIKPSNEEGLEDGIKALQTYLLALNQTVLPTEAFSAGVRFDGEVLIHFAQGQHIWRLEWCTNTPGVTQYHWTRSKENIDSPEVAYNEAQWVEISEQELKKYGGWVSQAVEGMVERRERLATFSEAVGLAIDIVGKAAMVFIANAATQERSITPQAGAKVLPFPSKPSAPAPPLSLPRASGL